jgi:hypothetical protein
MSRQIWAMLLFFGASDDSGPVAMVLSVQGDVKLRRMDLLRAGDQVRVPAPGSVRLVFLADGHRETLNPGVTVRIADSGGMPAEAVKREVARLAESHLVGLRKLAASARAGVSRIKEPDPTQLPASPIDGSTVLSDRPSFAWNANPDAGHCDVQLFLGETDRKENLVWSMRLAKDHLDYPHDRPPLKRGETYTWKVSARENAVVTKGRFTVATEERSREFEVTRKLSQSGEISDRLLAAMLFEAGEVYDESNRLFESLTRELPLEPWVILASARHLARSGRIEEALRRQKEALSLARGAP